MRRPRSDAPVAETSASTVVEPAPIRLKTSSLTAAVNAAVSWYANAVSKTDGSVIGRLNSLSDLSNARRVEQPPAFGQLAQRSLQFLHVFPCKASWRRRRQAGGGRPPRFRALGLFVVLLR